MNAIDHPLVAAYLDRVARETAELPSERRAELLADLREHIEISGAEDDARIREILAELGDPRTVAASALAEEPGQDADSPARLPSGPAAVRLTALLLTLGGVLALLNPAVGTVALLAGQVLLWTSPRWDTSHKLIGTAASVAVPVLVFLGALLMAAQRIGPTEILVIGAFALAVPAAGAVFLLRSARR